MNTLIEKNKGWLKFYSIAARIVGWTIIILNALPLLWSSYIMSSAYSSMDNVIAGNFFGAILECLLGRLPLGVILLGVAQLIRYICESEYQPPWLLRRGTFLLYLFAALTLITPFTRYWYVTHVGGNTEEFSTIMMSYVLPVFARVLVLIGLGSFLKRIMPVIGEYKSLV